MSNGSVAVIPPQVPHSHYSNTEFSDMFVQITDILLPNEVTVFKDTTIDKETFYTAKMPKKGGQRRLEIADILPNCV